MSSPASGLTCSRVRVLLEDYVDGALASSDAALAEQVRAHIATCDDCRRQHDQAVSLPFRLRALRAPQPPDAIVANVMRAIAPQRGASRRAWGLLVPEALLVAFIVWYLSGLEGLAKEASSALSDLAGLLSWGAGGAALPDVPVADVFLLLALIALALIAAYHLSVLSHLSEDESPAATWRERRRA